MTRSAKPTRNEPAATHRRLRLGASNLQRALAEGSLMDLWLVLNGGKARGNRELGVRAKKADPDAILRVFGG